MEKTVLSAILLHVSPISLGNFVRLPLISSGYGESIGGFVALPTAELCEMHQLPIIELKSASVSGMAI